MINVKSKRELEDNIQGIQTALKIISRAGNEALDVQSLYTVASQLNHAQTYVNQLIGACTAERMVEHKL